MNTQFFQSKKFRLFAILILTIIVVIIFAISATSYYFNYYGEIFKYKGYLNNLLAEKLVVPAPQKNALDPARGNSDAKVTIYEFAEYLSPDSALADKNINDIYNYYGTNNVQVVWKDFSISTNPEDRNAALAAHCAYAQNKFWEFKDILMQNQDKLNFSFYSATAQNLGLDTATFNACYEKNIFGGYIDNNYVQASNLGLNSSPVVYINNQNIGNNTSFNNLKYYIDLELQK